MRDLLVAGIVLVFALRALRRPHVGLLLFCWISFMNPHRLCYGFAVQFPWALIAALATLIGLLLSQEPKRIPWRSTSILLVVFLSWMFITTLFALNPVAAWSSWNVVWKIQLMTFLILLLINTRERIEQLVWVIVGSLGFYGIKGGIFTVLTGGGNRVWGPPGSFIEGNNEIGLALIMLIPLLRYLQLRATAQWLKNGLLGAMLITLICALGTQSRGALVGVAAMLLFLVAKSRNKVALLLVLALTVPLIYSFMPESWHSRMSTIQTYEKDASAMGRINAWYAAFNIGKDRVVGGGFKVLHDSLTFRLYAPDPYDQHDAHSIYFEVLAEHGFIGLGLFLGIGLSVWRWASKTIARAKPHDEYKWMADLCLMLQVSFVAYATAGAFLGLATFDLYYALIALVLATNDLLARTLVIAPAPQTSSALPALRRA